MSRPQENWLSMAKGYVDALTDHGFSVPAGVYEPVLLRWCPSIQAQGNEA